MRKALFFTFSLFSLLSTAQIKEYVDKNIIDITNQKNLIQVLESISENRIIMIGEQRHEDAATFVLKAEIVKILNEKYGYSILCLENPFYELNKYWQLYEEKLITKTDLLPGVVDGCWKNCKEFTEGVVKYVKENLNTRNEIKYLGIDSADSGRYLTESLLKDLSDFLHSYDLELNNDFGSLLKEYVINYDIETKEALDIQIIRLLKKLEIKKCKDHFMIQTLKSLLNDFSRGKRDFQMADNLLWILDKEYPNEKIIIWAHNSHISKNTSGELNHFSSMTHHLQQSTYKDSIYVIGFTSLTGIAGGEGLGKDYEVSRAKRKGIERLINQHQFEKAFIDFAKYNGGPFHMKGRSHKKSHKLNWHRRFDGIIYIENMYPCKAN